MVLVLRVTSHYECANQIRRSHAVTVMLALAVLSCAVGLGGVLYFAGLGHADDGALLAGNHPAEVETFRQLGEAD